MGGFQELMDIEIRKQLLAYAESQSPNEACGLIYRDLWNNLAFHPTRNISPEPFDSFAIDCQDYAQADRLGTVEFIFHSHTFANASNGKLDFSSADKQACKSFGIPWILLVLPQKEFKTLLPLDASTPLLGREWHWGNSDCYSLIRDTIFESGIYLNDYPRGDLEVNGEYVWNVDPNWHPYEDYFEQEGFIEVPQHWQLKKYDLLLMSVESRFDKINHAGIVVEPDKNLFYHHVLGRLSESSVWGGYWQKVTRKIIRHKSLLESRLCN